MPKSIKYFMAQPSFSLAHGHTSKLCSSQKFDLEAPIIKTNFNKLLCSFAQHITASPQKYLHLCLVNEDCREVILDRSDNEFSFVIGFVFLKRF